MKLPAEIEAVIERLVREFGFRDPRTAGTPTVELVWRSLKLQRDIYEHGAQRQRAAAGAAAIAAELPTLARKAVDAVDQLEVGMLALELQTAVDAELEQVHLDPRTRGKAMHSGGVPWSRDKSADFERLIRRIGGYTADGLPAGDPLDYDDAHFERATALVRGEAEPASAAEVRALATWRARYPES